CHYVARKSSLRHNQSSFYTICDGICGCKYQTATRMSNSSQYLDHSTRHMHLY
ncbi:hypothetical protein HAX54_050832, partial [Datura stramonium]|nr:hypothetical protein [Datura stramonium]